VDPQASSVTALYPPEFPGLTVVGNAVNLLLFVAGKPIPKGRPRTRVQQPKGRKAWAQIYTPETTVDWEETIGWQSREQLTLLSLTHPEMQGVELPLAGRGFLSLRFNFDKPKSTPKTVLFPVKSRTDWDNLAKAVPDALQVAKVLENDSMITDATVIKRYSEPGHPQGVEIDLTVVRN
jgi:Holliday junction resolvase RusA-like endonuclease